MVTCETCHGCGWVCENHPDRPWEGISAHHRACGCGAGQPCGDCNTDLHLSGFEGGVIVCSVEPIPDSQKYN